LNVHAPTEDKTDYMKELQCLFDQFPKYDTEILLGDFSARVGIEDILKPTLWRESLHKIRNSNGARIVNFATSKNQIVQSTMFPHHNIHKSPWKSPFGKTHNQIDHILIDRHWHSSALDVQSFMQADCDTSNYLVVAEVMEKLAVSKRATRTFYMERFNLKKLTR
jgi:hypothetical protein